MKVKTISRPADSRERIGDLHRVARNLDPVLHPFEKGREYTRALTATKLDRLFAKPFLAALPGHTDAIYAMDTVALNALVSGSADGELRLWSLSAKSCSWTASAHKGILN